MPCDLEPQSSDDCAPEKTPNEINIGTLESTDFNKQVGLSILGENLVAFVIESVTFPSQLQHS